MSRHLSLRRKLGLAALLLALLAVTAAALAVFGLARTQSDARAAMAAQRRIEGYAAHSARVNDWMLSWRRGGLDAPDPAPVHATLAHLDQLLAEDYAQGGASATGLADARQTALLAPGRLRSAFAQLQKALAVSPPGTEAGEAAIAFYAAQAPPIVLQQTDYETRRRDAALAAMEALRRPLTFGAIAIAISAPLVLLALYLFLLRPLFARLSHATATAAEIGRGGLPAGVAGHDELGLLLARLRQVAARLERRGAALALARNHLEATVAERTAALTEANARLAATDESRRRFFADVGHELRTPLTVILGEAELGARHADPAVRAGFETVHARALRLFRRIEDLLRVARSDSGQLELQSGPVPLPDMVGLACTDLAPVLKRAGVAVHLDLPPLVLEGDADWLRQVFAGLLENAAKYAGRGAEVRITGAQQETMAQIDVADTGPGLPEGEADPFDRFSRRAEGPGFGVGLALARWVVEASGGSMALLPAARGLHLRLKLPILREA